MFKLCNLKVIWHRSGSMLLLCIWAFMVSMGIHPQQSEYGDIKLVFWFEFLSFMHLAVLAEFIHVLNSSLLYPTLYLELKL